MEPTLIADYHCVCGEGPLWHPQEQRLYWVDIPTGSLFRYDPSAGTHEQCFSGETLGGFTIQQDGTLLLFMARGTIKIWHGDTFTTVLEDIPQERTTRFNDVIADPEGRVFCGTMPTADRLGHLYRLDPNGGLIKVLDNIGCSNGLGFSPDQSQIYYADSPKLEVYVFDYDRATGTISNQRVFVKSAPEEGMPDGLTVDAEGYVWVAHWDGGCVIRYTPDGSKDRRITFPAKKVSCITFGGPDYTDIYVTTAGGDDKATEGAGAGGLFHLNLGIKGKPEFHSRVELS